MTPWLAGILGTPNEPPGPEPIVPAATPWFVELLHMGHDPTLFRPAQKQITAPAHGEVAQLQLVFVFFFGAVARFKQRLAAQRFEALRRCAVVDEMACR